ncbi:LysR family transcriptional regulator [Cognatishimia sp. F0-27]|uniref:LysR family transcriptional regulator n=1 Tax=Cognatishimia sp. F0-27 TaxID=2816855 RepID=UPI001D0CD56D|nr:LysR family transcriptional regulator [Cognatishimia sp. F0-27]MCC1491925.1 LysR family transcriptional regulator [Cognatishimia sp. F0-27]
MNETPPALDDLALFLVVAESRSLSMAARQAAVPLPTLSRRMARLERDTGQALFLRGQAGYSLTSQGRALAEAISGLHDLRHRVARWQTDAQGPVPVRITAGFWTSRHLARQLRPCPDGIWAPRFLPSNATLDIARREVDIGIRNAPPDHPWMARQRLRTIHHAVYARDAQVTGYVALDGSVALPRSQRWVHDTHGRSITATATDIRLCFDLALNGFGRIVLPCFAGDTEPGLVRVTQPIDALTHEEWLASHHDARHDPPVRAAIEAVVAALTGSPTQGPEPHPAGTNLLGAR